MIRDPADLRAIDHTVDKLIRAAWRWGKDCEVDDLPTIEAVGDSHNESQRDEVNAIALDIRLTFYNLQTSLELARQTRDRTRAALEKMREERKP